MHKTLNVPLVSLKYINFLTRSMTFITKRSLTHCLSPTEKEFCYQRRVFSGIQPTGSLHLGNYLGAINNWIKLQDKSLSVNESKPFFCVVDLHALTTLPPSAPIGYMNNMSLDLAAALLACGISPERSTLFIQSQVPQHTELTWLLCCIAPKQQLDWMTQYKDKAKKNKTVTLGLFSYPVLMAADILLYQSTSIPVGDDQRQHLELARRLARSFNKKFKQNFFPIPEALFGEYNTRVMSLRDVNAKMSKSERSANGRIELTDSADQIARKVRKAITDSEEGISIKTKDGQARPGCENLLNIYSAITNIPLEQVLSEFRDSQKGIFKEALTIALIDKLCPIGKEIKRLKKERNYVYSVLQTGAETAQEVAAKNIAEIKKTMGLQPSVFCGEMNTSCTKLRMNTKDIKPTVGLHVSTKNVQ